MTTMYRRLNRRLRRVQQLEMDVTILVTFLVWLAIGVAAFYS